MKKIVIVAVTVLVVLFAVGIIKDQVIKSTITVVATNILGAPVHIDGFSLGILTQSVRISGFRIYNPKGFSRGVLIDLPKIKVKYNLFALLKQKIHLVNAEIELKEMGLEKNAQGQLSVDSLKVVQQQDKAKPAPQLAIQIDTLKLSIGRIVMKDYSAGKEPAIQVYDLNISKTYKNITSVQILAALILSEPMKAAGIQGAKIYGLSMLAGAGILPVAIAATLVGKDYVEKDFNVAFEKMYEVSSEAVKKLGKVTKEDKAGGTLSADVSSAAVSLRLKKISANKTKVIISARKYLFPKPEIANGVLYEISQKLK
ncbi:MAG: AsmA family protein [Candidatus Omnitrophica bacterium]|nr:AsmA family protein [Candidatus Omnitrophota bacterium]MDD5352839.1 AsmA family protein [Candidatus Omnitrophota bacterium]MDD5550438.1 AsmA family protein [Candidatus Omnitrophota bacterium]